MNNKIEIGNAVTMGQLLEFEIAFPGEEKLSIEQYLAGGSREIILKAATFFLGFKNHRSLFEDNREFLSKFFSAENTEFANQIYNRINEIEKTGVPVGIINPYSSLKLFEYYFSKPEEPQTQTNQEFEVNLFKAYLVLNSGFTEIQKIAFTLPDDLEDDLEISMMMFCMQYPINDKTNYDIEEIWITQIIKSIYLFEFLESDIKAQPLLSAFLKHFNCTTWKQYLKNLIPLTLPAIKKEKEAHTDILVEPGDNFEQGCAFIEKLIIDEQDDLDQNDFLTMRAKPFYKIADGVYRIIFDLFVVEKIFKGVYFLLRDVNENLPSESRIKDVRSFYGNEISEKILCYKTIESIYPNKCIRFSGKELDEMKIDGAPDYYVRKDKNILLFESKDFLIAADKKMSFDFNVYKEEFSRILDFEELPNDKIKPKAVTQLANSVRRILKKEFKADKDYHYRDVSIYPVLLTHDHQYDTPGFNELIDSWFQDELSKLEEEGLFIHRVKPLSVVNIDSIIYYQVGLAKNIPLHKILNLYHENKLIRTPSKKFKSAQEFQKVIMSKLIPFAIFISQYFNARGLWKRPPILNLMASSLFTEEVENRIK